MVKINKIYTRTGDDGTTGLVGGGRSNKDSDRVESFGEIDELNSWLGMCRTLADQASRTSLLEKLAYLENILFDIGAELATPSGHEWPGMAKIDKNDTTNLENWIDELCSGIPELRSFVLPGGTQLNASLHIARCVCRRAERQIIRLSRNEEISPFILAFINRLSDLLFAMARHESSVSETPEYLWSPGDRPSKE